jgi:hypothetical protein
MPLSAKLAHDAMFYGNDDEFVAALVPFESHGSNATRRWSRR